MRGIFSLTKSEQRVVIVIVVALVAGAFAKHEWNGRSQLQLTKPMPTPATTPHPSADDESALPDEVQETQSAAGQTRNVRITDKSGSRPFILTRFRG